VFIVEGKISISEILKKRKGSLPENFTIISCGGRIKTMASGGV
jgi:hypothetical protein